MLTPPLTAAPAYLAVSPDGSLAAIGGRDGSAEVWVVGAAGER